MRTKNTIFTAEEYMAQGFTAEEVALVIEYDTLHNKWADYQTTEEEENRMDELVQILGL